LLVGRTAIRNATAPSRPKIMVVGVYHFVSKANVYSMSVEVASIPTRDNSLTAYRKAAKVAEDYTLPYLLGIKSDYEQIFGREGTS
jgi:hypothetical protein